MSHKDLVSHSCVISCEGCNTENSTSGFIFDSFIVVPAIILAPHYQQYSKDKKLTHTKDKFHDNAIDLVKSCNFVVYYKENNGKYISQYENDSTQSISAVNEGYIGRQSVPFHTMLRSSSVGDVIWKIFKFENKWDFNGQQTESDLKNEQYFYFDMILYFIFLKLNEPNENMKINEFSIGKPQLGDKVTVIGTPFGTSGLNTFYNSLSQGIVSSTTKAGEVFFTDARCVPGMEGAAVWCHRKTENSLLGLVLTPMFWKANEWIGLSIVVSMSTLLPMLSSLLPDKKAVTHFGSGTNSKIEKMLQHCVLVRSGCYWGSGVLVNPNIVITCSHVVHADSVVVYHNGSRLNSADVVYRSEPDCVYDIAVLKLKESYIHLENLELRSEAHEGEDCYAVGYPCFDREAGLPPIVTSGIISRIAPNERQSVLIQTTAGVQQGASGGGLFDSEGRLVAIMACHCSDKTSGAVYPHVGLCVPVSVVMKPLQEYMKTSDKFAFNGLQISDPFIISMWKFGSLQEPRSKL